VSPLGSITPLDAAVVALALGLAVVAVIQSRRFRKLRLRLQQLQRVVEDREQQLERTRKAPRSMVMGDGLTGVANLRGFREQLRLQWRRTARSKLPLTVLIFDIDSFRRYNSDKGRQAGDECLRQIAATLVEELQRPGDIVARFGGDEFAVLLAETDRAGGLAVAERLREAVEALDLFWGRGSARQRLTVSAGLATAVPSPREQPESLIAAADRALHVAKRGGRNRVAI
jgi:diguanylate cyclase (GGDEF)-like protein